MLNIFTIVLDGMPFIERHLSIFEALKIPWRWNIVEGSSQNIGCTAWMNAQPARLSQDGTTEYLNTLSAHPNVKIFQGKDWAGKLAMVNQAVEHFSEPGILMEIDADEIWTSEQLERIFHLFGEHRYAGAMQFDCRYFLGPDIITVGTDCFGCHTDYEWRRAWRFSPGRIFRRHEPPEFPHSGAVLGNDVTRNQGLVFDHFAYATEAQVKYKEAVYGYAGLLAGWRELQNVTLWPVKLSYYFPHVDGRVVAQRITL